MYLNVTLNGIHVNSCRLKDINEYNINSDAPEAVIIQSCVLDMWTAIPSVLLLPLYFCGGVNGTIGPTHDLRAKNVPLVHLCLLHQPLTQHL